MSTSDDVRNRVHATGASDASDRAAEIIGPEAVNELGEAGLAVVHTSTFNAWVDRLLDSNERNKSVAAAAVRAAEKRAVLFEVFKRDDGVLTALVCEPAGDEDATLTKLIRLLGLAVAGDPEEVPGEPEVDPAVREAAKEARRAERFRRAGAGLEYIAAERVRQVQEEGYDSVHDAGETLGQLAMAAACYAAASAGYIETWGTKMRSEQKIDHDDGRGPRSIFPCDADELWPWADLDKRLENPTTQQRRDMLVKAGALIAAELDRLDATSGGASK